MAKKEIKLWHDDVRPSPENWHWVKTNLEAQLVLNDENFNVIECSLDHDLGSISGTINDDILDVLVRRGSSPDGSGYDLVKWMIENDKVPSKITIHSWNIPGAERMAGALMSAGYYCVVRPFKMPC